MGDNGDEMSLLKQELKVCESLTPTGQAADDLIKYTQSGKEPFHPEANPADNPWIGGKGGGGGGCAIL
tara:strand:+ start:125 stop:328 length:204 start_codon:yes stop_codon:yes gene_type:complete